MTVIFIRVISTRYIPSSIVLNPLAKREEWRFLPWLVNRVAEGTGDVDERKLYQIRKVILFLRKSTQGYYLVLSIRS